jgi:hypothetical protein
VRPLGDGKLIYRLVRLREDRPPMWLIMGRRYADGSSIRMDIPEVLWFDGRVTPGRKA